MDNFSGLKLLQLRRSRKITRGQLAQELGTSAATISDWETEKHAVREKTILKIAQYFGVEVEKLLKPVPETLTVYVPAQQMQNYESRKQTEPVILQSTGDYIDGVVQFEWRLFKRLINDYTSDKIPFSLGLMQTVNELSDFLWKHVKQDDKNRKLTETDVSQRLPWIDDDGIVIT